MRRIRLHEKLIANKIKGICSYAFYLEKGEIDKVCREKHILIPRQIATYVIISVLRDLTGENVAKIFKQDRCSIIHTKKVVKRYLDTDKEITLNILSIFDIFDGRVPLHRIRKFESKVYTKKEPYKKIEKIEEVEVKPKKTVPIEYEQFFQQGIISEDLLKKVQKAVDALNKYDSFIHMSAYRQSCLLIEKEVLYKKLNDTLDESLVKKISLINHKLMSYG